jgi:hypothetical protein
MVHTKNFGNLFASDGHGGGSLPPRPGMLKRSVTVIEGLQALRITAPSSTTVPLLNTLSSSSASSSGKSAQPQLQQDQKPAHFFGRSQTDLPTIEQQRQKFQLCKIGDEGALASCKDADTQEISMKFTSIIMQIIESQYIDKLRTFAKMDSFIGFMRLPPAYLLNNQRQLLLASKIRVLSFVTDNSMKEVKAFFLQKIPSIRPGFLLHHDLEVRVPNIFRSVLDTYVQEQQSGWECIGEIMREGSLFNQICCQVEAKALERAVEQKFDLKTTWKLMVPFQRRMYSHAGEERQNDVFNISLLLKEKNKAHAQQSELPLDKERFGDTW